MKVNGHIQLYPFMRIVVALIIGIVAGDAYNSVEAVHVLMGEACVADQFALSCRCVCRRVAHLSLRQTADGLVCGKGRTMEGRGGVETCGERTVREHGCGHC